MKAALVLTALLAIAMLVRSQPQTYCGRRLASALAYLCDSNWVKRSPATLGSSILLDSPAELRGSTPQKDSSAVLFGSVPQQESSAVLWDSVPHQDSPTVLWGSIPQQHALHMDRSKRQVVAECCDKPCSQDELLAYCY